MQQGSSHTGRQAGSRLDPITHGWGQLWTRADCATLHSISSPTCNLTTCSNGREDRSVVLLWHGGTHGMRPPTQNPKRGTKLQVRCSSQLTTVSGPHTQCVLWTETIGQDLGHTRTLRRKGATPSRPQRVLASTGSLIPAGRPIIGRAGSPPLNGLCFTRRGQGFNALPIPLDSEFTADTGMY